MSDAKKMPDALWLSPEDKSEGACLFKKLKPSDKPYLSAAAVEREIEKYFDQIDPYSEVATAETLITLVRRMAGKE